MREVARSEVRNGVRPLDGRVSAVWPHRGLRREAQCVTAFRPNFQRVPHFRHLVRPPSVLGPLRLACARVCALAAVLALLPATVAAQDDEPRLLTGLTAAAGPDGVALAWTVDETRAHRIAGFSCVYRTPAHLRLGVDGVVPCEPERIPAEMRGRTIAGLPEYGDYDFELVVEEASGGPGIPWPQRALRVEVTVTEDVAGPPGAGRAVTGAGPLVESCGPDGGAAKNSGPRPWRLDDVVSAAHFTHYPGRGWSAGGDAATPPDWPDPPSMPDLTAQAGQDAEPLRNAMTEAGADAEKIAALIASTHFEPVLARAAARTKALLRTGPGGARELRLHTSYPFGADYAFEARHAVPGWGDAGHPVAWAELRYRVDCPPPRRPNATHNVALALSDDAGGGHRLAHSGYGWWAVAPVGMFPERIVATKAGLSFGDPAPLPPETPASWRGRLNGHLFWDKRRFAVAGEVVLTLERAGGATRLSGRIDNVALAPLDRESLQPAADPPLPWRSLLLHAAPAREGAWSGVAGAGARNPPGASGNMPGADAFLGDWRAAAYGPAAGEVAGRLRLWTPLAAGTDPLTDWPEQALLVAGFGAARIQ